MGDGGKICYSKALATAGRVAYNASNGRVIYKRTAPKQTGILNIRLEYEYPLMTHNSRLQFIPGEEEPLGVGPSRAPWSSNQSTASMWLGGSMASASYIGDEGADTFTFSCVTDAGVYEGSCSIYVYLTFAMWVYVTATCGEFSTSGAWYVEPQAFEQPIFYGTVSYDDLGIHISS